MKDTITLNGVTYGTTAADIITGTVTLGESLTASELSVDTLSVEVTARHAPEGVYGDPVTYLRDGTLFGKFFLRTLDRIGKKRWRIDAVSAIGLLDNVKHYGGIYDGQDAETSGAAAVIADVIGSTFAYTVVGFEDVRLYGWLPIASRRENLQQVLFAIGGNVTKDENGDVVISQLADDVSSDLGKDRIFLGGKVTYPQVASAVRVTEHSYVKGNEVQELYSGEVAADMVFPPSGAVSGDNMYDPAMEATHFYASYGFVADATGLYDSVIIDCEPGITYEATRTRVRAANDVLRICWLKEMPVDRETLAYNITGAPINGTVGETMTARTTTGPGAKYLLVTYGLTEEPTSKNTLDVRAVSMSGQIIEFNEPHNDLVCTGATILDSGVNYAILSPSSSAVLSGKAYVHNQKVVTVYAEDSSGSDYVPEVTSCTLVSLANSTNVGQRVLAYYGGFKRVEQDIIVEDAETGETVRPGDRVTLYDPYGERSGGYIKTLGLRLGGLLRGSAVFETGYIPSGIGNNFKEVIVVDQSGTVQLPDTNMVRMVLIGGGSGGGGGYPGKEGKQPTYHEDSSSYTIAKLVADGDMYSITMKNGAWKSAAKYWLTQAQASMYNGMPEIVGTPMTNWVKRQPEYAHIADPSAVPFYPEEAKAAGYPYLLIDKTHCVKVVELWPSVYQVLLQDMEVVTESSGSTTSWALYDDPTPGGDGGQGGEGGIGGRIYVADINITPGDTISVTIGDGGEGGEAATAQTEPTVGEAGTATTATINGSVISSENGSVYPNGYIDVINGIQYGASGSSGQKGGAGGIASGYNYVYPGEGVGEHIGGSVTNSGEDDPSGSGGGASADADGGAGSTAGYGKGGAGADASVPPAVPAAGGQGGTGGSGGGGGGNAAGWEPKVGRGTPSAAGAGGTGGPGGTGAPGVVLIFYGDPVSEVPETALKDWYRQVMVDEYGKTVTVTGGYRSKYSGWQIDDFIEEVLGNG